LRSIHGNVVEVDAQQVALRIAVGEEASLQHAVGREADTPTTLGGEKAACSSSAK
jgi:hypothetical protein